MKKLKKYIVCTALFIVSCTISSAQTNVWSPAGIPLHTMNGGGVFRLYNDTVNDFLYVMGRLFDSTWDWNHLSICRYKDGQWSSMGYFNERVLSVVTYHDTLYASGAFTSVNGVACHNIAKYNGSAWIPAGDFNDIIINLKIIEDTLYACGAFDTVDTKPIHKIAKWNGSQWVDVHHCIISGALNSISDIVIYKGLFYALGNFSYGNMQHLAVFKDGHWVPVGTGFHPLPLYDMVIYKNKLIVGGPILKSAGNVGSGIQAWDGSHWSALGSSLQDFHNGYGYVAAEKMIVHDGDLYVSGGFGYAGHVPAYSLAKWNGSQWCDLKTGSLDSANAPVHAICFYHDTLFAMVNQDTINGIYYNGLAKNVDNCGSDSCSVPVVDSTGNEQGQQNGNAFLIYPNPASENLWVSLPSNANLNNVAIDLYNYQGRLIKTKKIEKAAQKISVNIQNLSAGIYLLQVKTQNKTFTQKMVLVK